MARGFYTILSVLVLTCEVTSVMKPDETNPGDFPFMARLSPVWYPNSNSCGGSLISSRTVLTAAHCVEEYKANPSGLLVTLGDYARNRIEESERTMKVSKIIVHEGYSLATFDMPTNDVGLVILEEEVDLDREDRSIISLPTDRSIYKEGGSVTVAGWGEIDTEGTDPNTLKKADSVIPNQKTCEKYWGGVGRILAEEKGIPKSVIEAMINSDWMNGFFCTSTPAQKRRFGSGDSGGPVFLERDDGTFTQLSLVSWNDPEDSEVEWKTDYDMSADVFFYLDWIKEHMV